MALGVAEFRGVGRYSLLSILWVAIAVKHRYCKNKIAYVPKVFRNRIDVGMSILQITIDDRLTQAQVNGAAYPVLFIAAIKLLVVVALLVLIVVSTVQVCCKANASNQ